MLRPRLYPFYGTTRFHREQAYQNNVGIADDLRPKTTADISRNHPNPVGRELQGKRDPRNAEHRHLVVAVHVKETSCLIVLRQHGVVLDRGRAESMEMKCLLHDLVSLLHRPINVSIIPLAPKDQV